MWHGSRGFHRGVIGRRFTHVADAEQYAALEGEHVIGDIRGRSRTRRVVVNDSHYNEMEGVR